jgi:wobble nucleotide-excising tRNase
MLTKIKKIRGLGVFRDYVADEGLPEFKQFNIIYGENGSGKTTISRLFAAIELGEHPEFPNLEYSFATQTGQLANGQRYARNVRVFNSDYIEASIGQFQSPLKHILVVGKENKDLANEVLAERSVYEDRVTKIRAAERESERTLTEKEKLFSSIAKIIGEATSGGSTLRNYRKPNAEAAFAKLNERNILSDGELESYRATVRQEQLEPVPNIDVDSIQIDHEANKQSFLKSLKNVSTTVEALLSRSAQSGAMKKLSEEVA